MQEEKEKEDLDFITKYNGHWTVQAAVVGSAIVLLLVILIYIHFDETLTKFVEDTKKAYKDLVKEVKVRIRRKYLKMTGKTKSLVAPEIIAKIRAIGQISLAFKVNKALCPRNFQNLKLRSTIQEFICHSILSEINFGKFGISKIAIFQFQRLSTLNLGTFWT